MKTNLFILLLVCSQAYGQWDAVLIDTTSYEIIQDTVPGVMLVGYDDGTVKQIDGYEVEAPFVFGRGEYLDCDKTPLPKDAIVWMFKRKRHR